MSQETSTVTVQSLLSVTTKMTAISRSSHEYDPTKLKSYAPDDINHDCAESPHLSTELSATSRPPPMYNPSNLRVVFWETSTATIYSLLPVPPQSSVPIPDCVLSITLLTQGAKSMGTSMATKKSMQNHKSVACHFKTIS